MDKPIPLDLAAYRAGLNSSLFEVIISKAAEENVSGQLADLIAIACDLNEEIRDVLAKAVEKRGVIVHGVER
ncbi:hypothetical protein [Dickeya dadantii]|uniref:Uncharacterized protein n=1 Tax=Dickeya dadantii (strain 3937) TaxID=198628 RepID=E0SH86_DICD3|nr:hypothetical protein [Dickeya dadantii]ADM96485.1 hypothetical protein Dda3937_01591 [Dickeya dadantii 3937]MCA7014124.1 hypothetical protein [Dickeya dadantii]NPE51618.1 hypothetical protein [Dickeya dadantii]